VHAVLAQQIRDALVARHKELPKHARADDGAVVERHVLPAAGKVQRAHLEDGRDRLDDQIAHRLDHLVNQVRVVIHHHGDGLESHPVAQAAKEGTDVDPHWHIGAGGALHPLLDVCGEASRRPGVQPLPKAFPVGAPLDGELDIMWNRGGAILVDLGDSAVGVPNEAMPLVFMQHLVLKVRQDVHVHRHAPAVVKAKVAVRLCLVDDVAGQALLVPLGV